MSFLQYWFLFFEAVLLYICPRFWEEIPGFEKTNMKEIKFHEKYFL